jgi:DNA-binding NarL/FixJ family response regulator
VVELVADTPTRISVLAVDDAGAIRSLVKLLLELEDDIHVVAQAENGASAVELAREHHPDVVLLDISMPVMDGMTALPLLLEASPTSRVVMLTGFGTADIRRRCDDLGAAAFVEKGSLATTIVDAVRGAAA